MNALRSAAAEFLGLFVEDRAFALAIALWLAASGALAYLHAATPEARALALFAGLALILIAGVVRGARGGG
jgi:hypothetical protein